MNVLTTTQTTETLKAALEIAYTAIRERDLTIERLESNIAIERALVARLRDIRTTTYFEATKPFIHTDLSLNGETTFTEGEPI